MTAGPSRFNEEQNMTAGPSRFNEEHNVTAGPSRYVLDSDDDDDDSPRPSEEAGPSTLWDDLAFIRKRRARLGPPRARLGSARRAENKRRVDKLQPEMRRQLMAMKDKKERGIFLMPDAPPKRSRKASPERVECPLIEGVPRVPPPRIPQPWEIRSTERPVPPPSPPTPTPPMPASPTPTPTPPLPASPTPTPTLPLPFSPTPTQPLPSTPRRRLIPIFSPSTGIRSASYEEVQSLSIIPAEVELVGFTPESSAFSSPQPQSPSLSTSAHPGSPSLFEDVPWRPIEGSDIEEDEVNPQDRTTFGAAREVLLELDAAEDAALRELSRAQGDAITTFEWSQDVSTFTGTKEQFLGPSGPTFPVNVETPLSILQRIWDVELMTMIVAETNKYARTAISISNSKSRISKWEDTTVDELWVFFAILIVQSLVPMPVEMDYWYPKLDMVLMSNLAKIMPFARFILLKKCLHFVDNEQIVGTSEEDKRLIKISPLIDSLRTKFRDLYIPAQEIALDESLLLWKGRLSFAQLIATKKARVGIKSYELCESKTGFLWDIRIYAGKGTHEEPDLESQNEPQSATSKIVFDLVRPLLGRGHVLVMDNFYNAPLLSRLLKKQKTDTMGTLRLNREFVPDSLKLSKSQMRQGEVSFSQTTDLTVVVWRDANVVPMISTYHKVEVGGKEKFGRYFYKPQVVLDYNRSMGGVDKKDQLLSAFPMERIRNQVWYKKLFRRMLNVSIMNSWIIFCTQNTMAARRYRERLVEEILHKHKQGWGPSGSVRVVAQNPVKRLLEGGHFPQRLVSRNHRCKWCSMHGRTSRTSYQCDVCNTALCIDPCFKAYHTQKE